jgi:hypothetical protein
MKYTILGLVHLSDLFLILVSLVGCILLYLTIS